MQIPFPTLDMVQRTDISCGEIFYVTLVGFGFGVWVWDKTLPQQQLLMLRKSRTRKDMIRYFLLFAISPTIVRTKPRMQVIVKIFQGKYAGAGEVRISIQSICP
jgi:hypothetical protein